MFFITCKECSDISEHSLLYCFIFCFIIDVGKYGELSINEKI